MLTLEQFHSGLANGSLARAHHIRLSDGLTEFPAALYQLAETLEILDLSGNQLTTLPDDLTRFARLRILFASNNPFSELPRVLGRMPQLEMVGFKACRIEHVPEDSLPPRLRWLTNFASPSACCQRFLAALKPWLTTLIEPSGLAVYSA